MAGDHETEHPDEAEGGPVKTFLEHLEDFRWVLIKGVVIASGGTARIYGSAMIEEVPADDVEEDEEPLETPDRRTEE